MNTSRSVARRVRRDAVVAIGVGAVALYAIAMAWAFQTQSFNVWGSLLLYPVIIAVNAVMVWRFGLRETDRWIVGLMSVGLAAKVLGSLARYYTIFVMYGGVGDAWKYNVYASSQYHLWRDGYFVWESGGKLGTQNLELLTTAVYTVIGPAPLAAFLVFSSFAFWGCYLIYRAFRLAVPEGDYRLYATLVFLLPSILFWPSSIGKEAWLTFGVGLAAFGTANIMTHRGRGWLYLLLGIVATAMIRPHITVLLAVGILVAYSFRPVGDQAIGVLKKALGFAVMGAAVVVLTTQSADFLGIDDLNPTAVTDQIGWASGQTEQGGSTFKPVPLTNPLGIPAAIATILFRPLPFEAHGLPMLMQSVEGLLLIWLAWKRRSHIANIFPMMRKNGYVTFSVIFALAFTIAFAGFSNFGILARQRTLMIPFAVVLLALPPREKKTDDNKRAGRLEPAFADSQGAA